MSGEPERWCVPFLLQGELLIDGGYLNNMPVDVMRGLGVDTVRAYLSFISPPVLGLSAGVAMARTTDSCP